MSILNSKDGRYRLYWRLLDKDGNREADCLGYYNSMQQLTPLAKEFGIANKILTRKKTLGEELVMFCIDHDTGNIYDYCPWEQAFRGRNFKFRQCKHKTDSHEMLQDNGELTL